MKRIWAPWRMTYIKQNQPGGCFLCDAFSDNRDRERLVLHRGKTCAVIMNRYPYNNGHLMIAPYRHVDRLDRLTDEEALEWMQLTARSIGLLEATLNPDGFNTGLNLGEAAGAGLKEHLHQHLVPRWNGDTNFMPVLSETKVIPQDLYDLYDQLRPSFDEENIS